MAFEQMVFKQTCFEQISFEQISFEQISVEQTLIWTCVFLTIWSNVHLNKCHLKTCSFEQLKLETNVSWKKRLCFQLSFGRIFIWIKDLKTNATEDWVSLEQMSFGQMLLKEKYEHNWWCIFLQTQMHRGRRRRKSCLSTHQCKMMDWYFETY